MSPADPGLRLGRIGAWLNPAYGDDARTHFALQAESLVNYLDRLDAGGVPPDRPIPAYGQLARVLL